MTALIPEAIDRPTTSTAAVRRRAIDGLMIDIIRWHGKEWRNEDEESIRTAVDDAVGFGVDGYEAASDLERQGWCPNAELVEILDGFAAELSMMADNAVVEWVKETKPQPTFKVGDEITADWGGKEIKGLVATVNMDRATYAIRCDDHSGFPIINFEDAR